MPALAATLVGTVLPQTVQLAATGLTVGQTYEITGHVDGFDWAVRGGRGVATATQVVIGDAATPLGAPITYRLATPSGVVAAAPVTVDEPDVTKLVLQSLDGKHVVTAVGLGDGIPRKSAPQVALYQVAGRRSPVVVNGPSILDSGSWTLLTSPLETAALDGALATGQPLVLRLRPGVRDLAPVEFVVVTGAFRTLDGNTSDRVWSIDYQVIDDPDPDTVVGRATWADVTAVYAAIAADWADVAAEWGSQTWAAAEREDWASRAP